jgi:hypothetical protein
MKSKYVTTKAKPDTMSSHVDIHEVYRQVARELELPVSEVQEIYNYVTEQLYHYMNWEAISIDFPKLFKLYLRKDDTVSLHKYYSRKVTELTENNGNPKTLSDYQTLKEDLELKLTKFNEHTKESIPE